MTPIELAKALYNADCGDPACPVCCPPDREPVKLSPQPPVAPLWNGPRNPDGSCAPLGSAFTGCQPTPTQQPIAISRWDHPEEWLRQYLARERSPVTHGWEGLDDETFTFFGVLRDGRVDESGHIE